MPKKTKTRSGKTVVVVEIGNDWLKIVQAEPAKGGVSVSKMHLERFDTLGKGVSESIASAFKEQKFSNIPVITCLPRQAATVRIVELPSTDSDEIADMVDLQIGKLTPYSKDEVASDYRIVGAGREGYTRVMLVIVQRSILRQRFYILEEAGLDVERMSVSTEGVLNWTRQAISGGGSVVLLDVDSFYSDLAIVNEGALVFTRSILVGANHLLEDYEKWKEKLSREIMSALEASKGESPGLQMQKLLVGGAGPRIDGLDDFLGSQLGLEIELVDSLKVAKRLPSTPSLDDPDYQPVSLTSVLGIGLAPDSLEFDLVPDSVRQRKGLEFMARSLSALGIFVMAALFSVSMYMTLKVFIKYNRLEELSAKVKAIEPSVTEVIRQTELTKVVKGRMNVEHSAANVFAALRPLVPEGIFFETVSLNTVTVEEDQSKAQELEVAGNASATPVVLRFMKNMENSALFEDVKDGGINKDNRTQKYKFKIRCRLENRK